MLTQDQIDERLTEIVMDTFQARPMPLGLITKNECERRASFALALYDALLNEMRWSAERILDHMPSFLVRRLDGQDLPGWATHKDGDAGSAMWGSEAAGRTTPERRLSALARIRFREHRVGVDGPIILIPKGGDNGS